MQNIRKSSHSIHQLHVHLVWSTKYRYEVLHGDIQIRCRDLIIIKKVQIVSRILFWNNSKL